MMHTDPPEAKRGFPRPLTREERQLIAAILMDDCPGALAFRAQLETAHVLRNWPPPGSPSIDLEVSTEAPIVAQKEPVLPMDVHIYDERGEYTGELIVWIADGKLAALECSWVTDAIPTSLPKLGALRISPK
jgi:hypothetical protein